MVDQLIFILNANSKFKKVWYMIGKYSFQPIKILLPLIFFKYEYGNVANSIEYYLTCSL